MDLPMRVKVGVPNAKFLSYVSVYPGCLWKMPFTGVVALSDFK